jgi:hypothetical protein
MKSLRAPLLALLTLSLLSLGIAALAWAQGTDTPIIISDGSLTIESRNVAWSQFTGDNANKHHPMGGKSVTAVDLAVNGTTQTIAFSGQQCTVTVLYAGTTITISTGTNGKGLQVATNFNSFHAGSTGNVLAHNDSSQKMGAISVRKGTATAFSGTGSGGSVITIHYR